MAKRTKPQGNKRQREQAKARKKRDKEARREARKGGEEGGADVVDASAFFDGPEKPDEEAAEDETEEKDADR